MKTPIYTGKNETVNYERRTPEAVIQETGFPTESYCEDCVTEFDEAISAAIQSQAEGGSISKRVITNSEMLKRLFKHHIKHNYTPNLGGWYRLFKKLQAQQSAREEINRILAQHGIQDDDCLARLGPDEMLERIDEHFRVRLTSQRDMHVKGSTMTSALSWIAKAIGALPITLFIGSLFGMDSSRPLGLVFLFCMALGLAGSLNWMVDQLIWLLFGSSIKSPFRAEVEADHGPDAEEKSAVDPTRAGRLLIPHVNMPLWLLWTLVVVGLGVLTTILPNWLIIDKAFLADKGVNPDQAQAFTRVVLTLSLGLMVFSARQKSEARMFEVDLDALVQRQIAPFAKPVEMIRSNDFTVQEYKNENDSRVITMSAIKRVLLAAIHVNLEDQENVEQLVKKMEMHVKEVKVRASA